jgi:3-deoxy-D-manno-octulosonic-acid transferase
MWDWAIWIALILGFAAGVGALAFLAVRSLQAWRDVKRVRRHVFKGLEELAARGELTAEKASGLGETEELERSVGRLRRSLAQLAVLREALDEAQDTLGRITAVVPRK